MEKTKMEKEQYSELVDRLSPKNKVASNCMRAFIVGGLICTVGQFIHNLYAGTAMSQENVGLMTSVTLIFLGIFFTAVGVYDILGKYAGAGSSVPITGFANAIASAALEFKREGMILGMGAKIFIVAGPVIVYGVATSMVVGLIYYLVGVIF